MASSAKLIREYRCAKCFSRITEKYIEGEWVTVCCACNSTEFVHEYEAQRQKAEAKEVLAGLPDEFAAVIGHERKPKRAPRIFSLAPLPEVEI